MTTSAQVDSSGRLKYLPAVDGLRGIAVLAVVIYHAGLGLPGGFLGVDVFFVISGYLITSLIIRDLERGQFSLGDFWTRRVKRIMPAAVLVMLACLGMGLWMFTAAELESLADSLAAQSLFAVNIYLYQSIGYFNPVAEQTPLLHYWSLAVEEQFYIFYPFLLLVVWKFKSSAMRVGVMIGLFCLSFGACVYATRVDHQAAFFLLPFRAWELLAGGLLAYWSGACSPRRWAAEVAGLMGVLLLGASFIWISEGDMFPGYIAGVPVLGSVLLIYAAANDRAMVCRVLSLKPLVFVGLVSYSFYLWHWPVLVFWSYGEKGVLAAPVAWVLILVSFLCACFSYRYVEQPFRYSKVLNTRRRAYLFAGVCIATLLPMAGVITFYGGAVERIGRVSPIAQVRFNASCVMSRLEREGPRLLTLASASRPTVLVWGDSHAAAAALAMSEASEARGLACWGTQRATVPPFFEYWDADAISEPDAQALQQAVIQTIQSQHITDVLLAARWNSYVRLEHDGRDVVEYMASTIHQLESMGVRVWVMRQVPFQPDHDPAELPMNGAGVWLGVSREEHADFQARVDELFASLPASVGVLDSGDYCLRDGRMLLGEDYQSFYYDDDHFSDHGARVLLRPMADAAVDMMISRENAGHPESTNGSDDVRVDEP